MRHDIKRDIRQALGLDRDDDSMDDEIDNMTVERQFGLFCDWHGLISWGDSLMAALDNLRQAKENR